MAKITIELDDNVLAAAIAEAVSGASKAAATEKAPAKAGKAGKASKSKSGAPTIEDVITLCKELGPKLCRDILKEAGFSSLKALEKDGDDMDKADLEDLYRDLKNAGASDDEDDEDEDDDDEDDDDEDDDDEDDDDEDDDDEDDDDEDDEAIDVETVKKAVQAFAKANGKGEADEILAEFDIKSVRSLNKLSQDDLEELYEAVTEE